MRISSALSLFYLFSLYITGHSQINPQPPTNTAAVLNTDFSKQNTTWNWSGRFRMADSLSGSMNWYINELFQSNLITPNNASKQWKDEHKLKGLFYKRFSAYSFGLYTDSWLLYDKQQINRNEYSNHAAGLFYQYNPADNIIIKPYAGYQRAKNTIIKHNAGNPKPEKITNTDWGWDTGFEGKAGNLNLGEYTGTFNAKSDYDFFEQRKNYNNNVSAGISTRFSSFASDSLNLGYEESSKQFYNTSSDQTGNPIIEVRLFNRNIRNQLFYNFSNRQQLKFETNILSKHLYYSTSRDVFFIENVFRFQSFGERFNYQVGFRTNDETMDNDGIKTDSRTRQSAIDIKTQYKINASNNLNIDLAYVKMQYDTPDDNNNDDRDEQRFIINLQYYRKISPVLELNLYAYGFLFHQIYIFREQSINNNWNRVIKIEPQIVYRYKRFENRLSTSVIANYTAYDFEDLTARTRSFLFRKYTLSDSLSAPVVKSLSVGLQGKLELSEKGSFFKKTFAQNIVQTYASQNINLYLMKEIWERFQFKFGYSYFARTEWRHIPVKIKNREITNKGPFISFAYNVLRRINLSAYAAINYINDSKSIKSQYNTGYLRLMYNL